MSIELYYPNGPYGPEYKIGTIDWEGWTENPADISTWVPTYGLWAGPEWSGGKRVLQGDEINWAIEPCMDNSIMESDAVPATCYSLVDVITKRHDWDYYQAELNGNNAQMVMNADVAMLNTIESVSQQLQSNGIATYSTVKDGTIGTNGEVNITPYTGTSFDSTENKYLSLLVPAFTIKLLLWDAAQSLWSQAVGAFQSIWSGLGLSSTTYSDPSDASHKIIVKEQTNGSIVYEGDKNRTATGWVLDANATKAYTTATVTFGAGGVKPENTYEYLGNGVCKVYGSNVGDRIVTSTDTTHQAQLILEGGAGEDKYYFAYGSGNDKINDSGENQIFWTDEYGKYHEVGNFYKKTTDVAWSSIDGKEQLAHASPWTITLPDGSTIELGSDFQDGDFGIRLIDIPNNPLITNTILGDQNPPYYNDSLWDTAGNDRIEGGLGDDDINTFNGGNDWLMGGDGSDIVNSLWHTGTDIIEGGAGSDLLSGGDGDDKVFAESYGEMADLIASGETAQGINERGDLASGGAGNDFVYGANRNDALFGGDGHDLIVGGAGDDAIFGDDDDGMATRDWSFAITQGSHVSFNNVSVIQSAFQGDDVIYAGTGNDFVYAGGGGDEVYAGDGDDTVIGEGGDDFIEGGAGNDILEGDASWVQLSEQGNDYIDGGAGDDRIWGQAGSDDIFGGDGNDEIYGDDGAAGAGDDYIDGEAGDDKLYGSAGSDTIFGGDGNDELYADVGDAYDGDDYLDGEAGDDKLYGFGGNDTIFGGDGNDYIEGDYLVAGDDYIDGEAGNDTIIGAGGSDQIYGGDGDDILHGDAGNVPLSDQGDDYIDGGAGNDVIVGYAGNDEIYGGADNDKIWGGLGDNTMYGDDGNDEIYGDSGNDYIEGGAGDDYIQAGAGDNTIYGDDGNDQIWGGSGNDTLNGGAGADTLVGDAGNDTYLFGRGSGQDTVNDYDATLGNIDTIILDADVSPVDVKLGCNGGRDLVLSIIGASDTLTIAGWFDESGYKQVERIQFADGTIWDVPAIKQMFLQPTSGDDVLVGDGASSVIDGGAGSDTIYGGSGYDMLIGGSGDDQLYGRDGNDILMGAEGNDVLIGGRGDDTLDGGSGDDTFYGGDVDFYGNGVVHYSPLSGNDTYLFGSGSGSELIIDYSDYSLGGDVDSILLGSDITPDDVKLRRANNHLVLSLNGTGDQLTVKDWFWDEIGGPWRVEHIQYADGTIWDVPVIQQMVLQGTSGDDSLTGYELSGDVLRGLEGNDVLSGLAGYDTLDGGPGDDILYGGAGDDMLAGGEGNDLLYDTYGNDVLDGGAGNDHIEGGYGNDTYIFGRGYGQDTIMDAAGNMDTVALSADVLPEDVKLSQWGNDLYLTINDTSDSLLVNGWFSSDANKIEKIAFIDGTVWDTATIQAMTGSTDDYIVGTPGNDVIDGGGGNDEIVGLEGNDTLYGGAGDDTLFGEYGDDILYGSYGYDSLYGQEDNDILYGGADDDYLDGGDGNNELYGGEGNDTLIGSYGVNVMDGGPGDDYIDGRGEGENTYIINRGSGFDSVQVTLAEYPDPISSVRFGEGITLEDIIVQTGMSGDGEPLLAIGIGNDEGMLIRGYQGGGGGVYMTAFGYLEGESGGVEPGLSNMPIRRFIFADGRELTIEEILARADSDIIIGERYGTEDGDSLRGSMGEDYISGNGGDDVIDAGLMNDEVSGGSGNDIIAGGKGDDYLIGDDGSDVFAFNCGDGQDYINSWPGRASGDKDVISFGKDIQPADVSAYIDTYGDVYLKIAGSNDQITIHWFQRYFDWGTYTYKYRENLNYGISRVQFIAADGSVRVFDLEGVVNALKDDLLAASSDNPVSLFTGTTAGFEVTGSVPAAGGEYVQSYARTGTFFVSESKYEGTEGDDVINTGPADDVINAKGGNDIVSADGGNDTIDGGSGDDIINAGDGDDVLVGGAGNDVLDGGTGADTMIGGAGNDVYMVDSIDDVVAENANEGMDAVQSSITYALGATVENLTLTGSDAANGTGNELDNVMVGNSADNVLSGGAGNDAITGGAGNDTITGGRGNDILNGGVGDDTYVYKAGDGIDIINDSASATEGNTLVFSAGIIPDSLSLSLGSLVIKVRNDGDEIHIDNFNPDDAYGAHAIDTFQFADGASLTYSQLIDKGFDLTGTAGDDAKNGTNVVDRITTLEGNDTISSGAGDDILDSGSGNDVINAGDGNDILIGGAGNDVLYGGQGADAMMGGSGDDTYIIDNVGDAVTENIEEGTDAVQSSINYALEDNVENLALTGSDAINGTGNELNNILTGNAAANVLDGGTGADIMIGGAGDDIYIVDNVSDVVAENVNEGNDTVQSLVTYTLGDNVEILTLTGNEATNGAGNTLNNILTGNAAANVLDGSSGADTMIGGAGDDTYIVDNAGDVVTENADEGTDTVLSSVSFTLSAKVENLALAEGAAINATGNNLDNILTGNDAANTLTGGEGNDIVDGGAGDDSYIYNVGDGLDRITDSSGMDTIAMGQGIDYNHTIVRLEGFTAHLRFLDAEYSETAQGMDIALNSDGSIPVETITFADGASFNTSDLVIGAETTNGTNRSETIVTGRNDDTVYAMNGNDFVYAGTGNDTIYGGNGNDMLFGDGGNDRLYGENGCDILHGGKGDDILDGGNGCDFLYGDGGHDILIGGNGSDVIVGSSGNDTLDGGEGVDILTGGAGNDTYVVENAFDAVVEFANEGSDTIQSSITFRLGANVENLSLSGSNNINGTGNALDNIISGNSGVNTLSGSDGNDTLDGKAGNDTLEGGDGSDAYLLRRMDGNDTINETAGLSGDTDTVKMTDGITETEPVVVKQNNDLYLFVDGDNYMRVTNQFTQANYGIERLEVSDGCYITRADIENIVNTMSAINTDPGMDVIQKFNAMQNDQMYISTLAQSWHQA